MDDHLLLPVIEPFPPDVVSRKLQWLNDLSATVRGGAPQSVIFGLAVAFITILGVGSFMIGTPALTKAAVSKRPRARWRRAEVLLLTGLFLAWLCVQSAVMVRRCHSLDAYLAGLAFVLRLSCLVFTIGPDAQATLLVQQNALTALSLVFLSTQQLLPCIDATVNGQCAPDRTVCAAICALVFTISLTAVMPREWALPPADMPRAAAYVAQGPTPEQSCSAINYYFALEWLSSLIYSGSQRKLRWDDLPPLPWYEEPLLVLREVCRARTAAGTTLETMMRFLRGQLLVMIVLDVGMYLVDSLAPFSLFQLLSYLSDPDGADVRPWVWLMLMFLGQLLTSIMNGQWHFLSTRLASRVTSGLIMEMYDRMLESMELGDDTIGASEAGTGEHDAVSTSGDSASDMAPTAVQATTAGRIANLISADVYAVHDAQAIIRVLFSIPIGLLVSVIGLYYVVGWTALVGTAVLGLGAPFSIWVARRIHAEQQLSSRLRDARISAAAEYLASIQAVKHFAWETAAARRVEAARDAELHNMWDISVLHVWPGQLSHLVPYAALLVVFFLYVGVAGQQLDAPTGFTTVFLLNNIKSQADQIGAAVSMVTRGVIALARLDRFFAGTKPRGNHTFGPLRIFGGCFRRTHTAAFRLRDISVDFAPEGLTAIIGPSGSGKTTLLLSILGETVCEAGSVTRPADVAFASQTSWLRNQSVRDNILFRSRVDPETVADEARYLAVVWACCLGPDLARLPRGDATRVGEAGAALSGGQRARVALARALYSRAPLLLLDDVFAALDAKTAGRVWDRCFGREQKEDVANLTAGRTVVLVTQIPWISELADLTVRLADGAIVETKRRVNVGIASRCRRRPRDIGDFDDEDGRHEDGMAELSHFLKQQDKEKGDVEVVGMVRTDREEVESEDDGENSERSHSQRLTCLYQYVGYFGSTRFVAFCFLLLAASKSIALGRTWLLSKWVDDGGAEAGAMARNVVGMAVYLGVYATASVLESVSKGLAILAFSAGSWTAGQRLHRKLFGALMAAPLSWYRTTPIGRVIDRLSRDVGVLDSSISWLVREAADHALSLVFRVGAVASVMPVFAVPAVAACALAAMVGEMYTRAAVGAARLVDRSQAPLYSHFVESLAGLAVIRARADKPAVFADEMAERLRLWARAHAAAADCHRWMSVRLDLACALVGLCAGALAVWKAGDIGAGLVGLSLANSTELSGDIINLVRMVNALEVEIQSFDRIVEYTKVLPEDLKDDPHSEEKPGGNDDKTQPGPTTRQQNKIPQDWPARGEVEFRSVTVKYDLAGKDVLKEMNLKLRAGERVAIVGRTGAGKSTLVSSLLRFTHVVAGDILIDGLDISWVPRRRLREAVTVIPQEATLLQGSVGFNVDPTGRVPAERVREALAMCSEAAPATATTGESWLRPETAVAVVGANLSHGQRQVVSVCRALARGSRVLLLDEATASTDYQTDRALQRVLRRYVRERAVTLVVIAHRLRTIVDFDSVVVMGGGRILECGPPQKLFATQGAFYDMVQQSGEAAELAATLATRPEQRQ